MVFKIKKCFLSWHIYDENKNIVSKNEQQIGRISPFFSLKPHIIEFYEKYNIAFIAGIYVITEYLMHEDDLIIV